MKNKQAIYLLFAANSISGFAQGISMIAIAWYLSNVLNLPSFFGNVYLAITFASLFLGLYAGSIIDKFNRRNIFILSSIVGGLVVLAVSLYGFYLGLVPKILIATVFASTFFFYNIHYPNLFAFAQEITEPKDYGRIISYIEIQGQVTTALAGACAAILLQGTESGFVNLFGFQVPLGIAFRPWSLHEIFLMDAATYLLAIILISRINYTPVSVRTAEYHSAWTRIKTGFDFLRKNPLIFIFGNASYSIFVTVLVIIFLIKPLYIKNHLGQDADVYASFEMYFALGSLLAGIAIRHIFKWTSTVMAIIIMTSVAACIYFINVINSYVFVFYAVSLILGLCNAGTRIMRMTYLFNHIPNQIIGRTGSVFIAFNVLFRIIFIFILSRSFFVEGGEIIYAFLILGIFVLISALVLALYYKPLATLPVREIADEPV